MQLQGGISSLPLIYTEVIVFALSFPETQQKIANTHQSCMQTFLERNWEFSNLLFIFPPVTYLC